MDTEERLRSNVETDVMELPFLLPRWQVVALETVAHQRGMTTAAMLRALLSDFLAEEEPTPFD
jgi:hypothetical protein